MPYPATSSDFPPGSDERIDAALATAGTTDPVDAHIADWKDYDEDHTEVEAAKSEQAFDNDEPFFQEAEFIETIDEISNSN
jgi:phosphoketolase